jgi:hypothetical protein
MPSDETSKPPSPKGPPKLHIASRQPLPGHLERLKKFDKYAQSVVKQALKRAAKLNPPLDLPSRRKPKSE